MRLEQENDDMAHELVESKLHLSKQLDEVCAHTSLKPLSTIQGPVVQSVVSLMSSLRVISLTVLADSIYNILIFFAEKM